MSIDRVRIAATFAMLRCALDVLVTFGRCCARPGFRVSTRTGRLLLLFFVLLIGARCGSARRFRTVARRIITGRIEVQFVGRHFVASFARCENGLWAAGAGKRQSGCGQWHNVKRVLLQVRQQLLLQVLLLLNGPQARIQMRQNVRIEVLLQYVSADLLVMVERIRFGELIIHQLIVRSETLLRRRFDRNGRLVARMLDIAQQRVGMVRCIATSRLIMSGQFVLIVVGGQ